MMSEIRAALDDGRFLTYKEKKLSGLLDGAEHTARERAEETKE